jgi:hypothetical protein
MHPRERELPASDEEPPRLPRRVAALFIVASSVALWALIIAGIARLLGD